MRPSTPEFDSATAQLHWLQRAIDSTENGITVADASIRGFPIIFANPAFLRLTGYTREEVLGRSCRFLQAGDTDQPDLAALTDALAHQREATVLLRNYRKDGHPFWNELTVSPMLDTTGTLSHYIGIQHDVTERVVLSQEIQSVNSALRERSFELHAANKELEAFSYSVSHDLRGPLAAIKAFGAAASHALRKQDYQMTASYLARIGEGAVEMGALVDALLRLATLPAVELSCEPFDLTQLASDLMATHAERSGRHDAVWSVEQGMTASADRAQIRVVLDNLIGNAWKFSGSAPARVECGIVDHAAAQPVFFVRDHGAGFDMAHASKLFEVFQRLPSAAGTPGSGIGLATVKRILARHGGNIWATSAIGQGATFFFCLGGESAPAG